MANCSLSESIFSDRYGIWILSRPRGSELEQQMDEIGSHRLAISDAAGSKQALEEHNLRLPAECDRIYLWEVIDKPVYE